MRGFLLYLAGCATVAALTLPDPDTARWIALAILAALYLASAVPRRNARTARANVQASPRDGVQPARGKVL